MEANVILPEPSNRKDGAKFRGVWKVQVFDNAENMNLISESENHNIITDEGLNDLQNVYLFTTAKISTWYCYIFESNSTPAANWTYAVPSGTEWVQYDEATRPVWTSATSSAKSTTNSASKAVFTANTGAKTLYGAGLVSVSTKGDHSASSRNVLFCAGTFSVAQPVIAGNVVNLTYTVTSADDGV